MVSNAEDIGTTTAVLVIDDDVDLRGLLSNFVRGLGYSAVEASSGEEGISICGEIEPGLVLLDLRLPDMDGLEVLKRLKQLEHSCPVVMMSAYQGASAVMDAIRLGATHYLTKPTPLAELRVLIDKLLEPPPEPESELEGLVGASEAMQDVFRMIHRVAGTRATVLIRGESGTGKELVARAIHTLGSTRDKPFISVDCTNIPGNLMESELFGHERGAFTDAKARKQGLLEVADQGTLLLDEIGLMPINLQAKLLSVLETQRFRRVGSTQQQEVSVRFLAATNEDLEKAVAEGRFREDLYYRLNVVPMDLPPLRERSEDSLLLAKHCLNAFSDMHGSARRRFGEDACELVKAYPWPGNVRELRNVVERAVLMTDGEVISAADLEIDRRSRDARREPVSNVAVDERGSISIQFPEGGIAMEAVERELIEAALKHAGGNVSQTAALLAISRDKLRYRMRKFGINNAV